MKPPLWQNYVPVIKFFHSPPSMHFSLVFDPKSFGESVLFLKLRELSGKCMHGLRFLTLERKVSHVCCLRLFTCPYYLKVAVCRGFGRG